MSCLAEKPNNRPPSSQMLMDHNSQHPSRLAMLAGQCSLSMAHVGFQGQMGLAMIAVAAQGPCQRLAPRETHRLGRLNHPQLLCVLGASLP